MTALRLVLQQVHVVPVEEYVVPEGNRPLENNRKARNRAKYTPRAVLRAAAAEAATAAA
jgi:hypothetical protein